MSNTAPRPQGTDDLFRGLAAGDREAFGAIVAHVRERLRRFAAGRLKRVPDLSSIYEPEDAIQSGLGEIWKGIVKGKIVPPAGFDTFLKLARTIIGRGIMGRARQERLRRSEPIPPGQEWWADELFTWLVADRVDLFEMGVPSEEAKVIARDEVEWLLSLLGPDHRPVIAARLEGHSVPAIAARLGIPRRTVERRLKEAIYICHEAARKRDR